MNEFYNPNLTPEPEEERAQEPYGEVKYDEPEVNDINIVVDNSGGFCTRCGAPLEAGDVFCSKCGAAQGNVSPRQQSSQHGEIFSDSDREAFRQAGRAAGRAAREVTETVKGRIVSRMEQHMRERDMQQSYGQDNRQMNYAQGQHVQQGQTIINNYYTQSNTQNNTQLNVNGRYGSNGRPLKSKAVALILCVLFGWCGAHRYYEGKIATGIIWTLTAGLGGIGWLVDLLILVFKSPYYEP